MRLTMKTILVITYHWPPSTGAAVQRLTAFCRYLPEFGFSPIVLTPDSGNSGEREKIPGTHHATAPVFDPGIRFGPGRGASGVTERNAKPWMEWIRLNFFIPDAKIGWKRPARKKAASLIAKFRPDLILTTAPPYTTHLIGLALKKRHALPWIADFQDPWLENHAYNTVRRNQLALALNRRMETAVLKAADHIISAMDSQRELLAGKIKRSAACFTTVHNGYEPRDFPPGTPLLKPSRFFLSHFGTVYDDGLDRCFFERLARLLQNRPDFRKEFVLRMTGPVSTRVQDFLKGIFAEHNLRLGGTVAHREIVRDYRQQQVLLLLINHGKIHRYSHPSKMYEYLASGNPVLAAGPGNHESMTMLRQAASDRTALADGNGDWEKFLLQKFDDWRNNAMPRQTSPPATFNLRNLTANLARICSDLTQIK